MSDDDSDGDDKRTEVSTQNTMRERAGESRLKIWLLLSANRFAVTAVLAAFVFVGFFVFAVVVYPPLQSSIEGADTIETLFTTMIGVLVTGTTLVVTISQLVISQENGPLGDQRQRMSDAMDFRTYSNELFGQAPPADPSTFLRELVGETARRAELLAWVVDRSENDDLERQVDAFVESIQGNATTVSDKLDDAQFGSYDVVGAALDFNYAWKIYQVERLTDEFEASLADDERAALTDLQDALAMFGPAREHIKTLYFQWALVDISQYILYAAVPALIVAGGMATFVGGATFGGDTLFGAGTVTWVTAVAFTISLVPFLLFTAYILRIATIAKRTLAIGPLILRDSQR